MLFYEKELLALKRSGRFRRRVAFNKEQIDLASNDYLGLATHEALYKRAFNRLEASFDYAPRSSMLVNGYHAIHQEFEAHVCEANGFEAGLVVGSGFAANIAMIEALARKGDLLLLDELYHASGQLASKLVDAKVLFFKHNDAQDLLKKAQSHKAKRLIVAVEGIYSMDGDSVSLELIQTANRLGALIIFDEAHSSGVIGDNLLGVLDAYNLNIEANYIKMGTLGKAYGSFGAYILASKHIISYLENRAKPIIYATAPSLFDTAVGLEAFLYIQSHKEALKAAIKMRQDLAKKYLHKRIDGLIVPIIVGDNKKVLAIQEALLKKQIVVGAIRTPTVPKAIMRLILRLDVDTEDIEKALKNILNI